MIGKGDSVPIGLRDATGSHADRRISTAGVALLLIRILPVLSSSARWGIVPCLTAALGKSI